VGRYLQFDDVFTSRDGLCCCYLLLLLLLLQAHLRVVSCFTWHAGTSYLIVAEPEVAPTGAGTPAAPAA
jgi:hypothetical protein